jgi:hypothetical protein
MYLFKKIDEKGAMVLLLLLVHELIVLSRVNTC